METVALQAVLQKLQSQSVEASGIVANTRKLSHGLDITVFETFTADIEAKSALQKTGLQPLDARGTLQKTLEQSVSLDTRVVFRRLTDLATEGLIQKQGLIFLGISSYLKHVVACWQSPSAQAETWGKAEGKNTTWIKSNAKESIWDSEEESPNGCNSPNT